MKLKRTVVVTASAVGILVLATLLYLLKRDWQDD